MADKIPSASDGNVATKLDGLAQKRAELMNSRRSSMGSFRLKPGESLIEYEHKMDRWIFFDSNCFFLIASEWFLLATL